MLSALTSIQTATLADLPDLLRELDVKSITFGPDTVGFGINTIAPVVFLSSGALMRSTLEEVREELRDAITRQARSAKAASNWLDRDAKTFSEEVEE